MRYLFITILTLLSALPLKSMAQSSAVKSSAKSVFTLTTYDKDGSVIATSHGVFIGNSGEAISSLSPFIGASRAVVSDTKGNEMNVSRILGFNDLYNIARFKVDGKTVPLRPASTPASSGSQAWLLPYSTKSPAIAAATVKGVETFMDKYSYYIFKSTVSDNTDACPFVNAEGQVIGLMQPSATTSDIHAVDANFAMSLVPSGFSLNSATARKIAIPMALPDNMEQARLALMIAGQSGDSIKHAATIRDFIERYPNLVDGYTASAQTFVGANDFDAAAREMEAAIKNVTQKDEAHFNYGKLIYDKEIFKGDVPYSPWNLDKALEETDKAYSINPQPMYQNQRARVLFAKGNYAEAYDLFMSLTNSSINNPELYYEAARCKRAMGANTSEIIALLDNAINNTDTLRLHEAAPYFLERAEVYNEADSFRQAVFDYTRYEILSNGNVSANFYYVREQAEIRARLYKQALIDITTAILLAPAEPMYYAEKASLELKVNRVDDAVKTAELCVKVAPDYPEGYLLLGLALINKGDKAEGLANLEKAEGLGSEQARPLIDKYSR